ncbi:MAG: caspase family protein [Candidatus Neomarinimicrobiota bacterium]
MKIRKMITISLLISVLYILCINVNNFNDPQNSIKDNQITQLQNENELTNYEELNFDSLKSSSLLNSKEAYAIVVGVSDYPGTSADLSYCDDDSQDIYSMLINDFNFKSENVIYLQDSSATKGAISNAFDQIAALINEDDIFFFYYSGHGGAGTSSSGTQSHSIDSPHPYSNNLDRYWNIYRSGAVYMRVHFDHFDVEYNYDYVLLGDTDLLSGYYYEAYTGYSTGFWSGWIPLLSDNKLYINLYTDSSVTEWGFSIDSYEVEMYDGTHFLCSYDSIPSTPSNYYMDDLLDSKLDMLNCDEKYVVLDACNTGGMIPEIQEIGRSIMTACRDDELSLEDPSLQHGVFTNFFLESFDSATDSNADGVISMEESYSYTSSNTISYSGGVGYTHHPQQYDGISGESVLFTAFGALNLTLTGNSLSYSFHMYGTGLIEDLRIAVCNVSETITYAVEDLTESSASNTGFGYYSGTIQLNGVTGITDYGIFARINGNEVIFLNQTVSNDSDLDSIDDITEIMFGMNVSDTDSDSDGLDDYTEFYGITDPLSNDTDNDGMDDFFEVIYNLNPIVDDSNDDEDGDGLVNLLEYQLDSLVNDTDTDDDGMDDYWEYYNSLDLLVDDTALDPDFDNIPNIYEYGNYTNPQNPDTDGDGLDDGDEILTYLTNPNTNDTDGDGLTDDFEILVYLTNATDQDTEGDGMDDFYEYTYGLDPLTDDSGLDLDDDGLDNLLEFQCGTSPHLSDSDGDFMTDYYEYNCNLNPLLNDANLDYDNDGLSNLLEFLLNSLADDTDSDDDLMPDFWEYNNGLDLVFNDASLDTDNDGLYNFNEFQAQTDPNNPDTDADGLFDGLEFSTYFTDPLNPDTDGDGYSDGIEAQWGTDPLDSKISLNTVFFNIAGIAILSSSSYLVVRTTITNKKQKSLTKTKKDKVKIVKKPNVYNAIKMEKKFKPKPKLKPSPYTRSSYAQSYSRPSYTQTRPIYRSNNVEFKKIIDLILYGLPPPKSIYSVEGKKAQNFANYAFRDIDQGRFSDGFNNMINALILGVPEPMNSRIKTILLKSLSQFSSDSQSSNAIQKSSNTKKCSWCGKENKISNKFCLNCGRGF